MKSFLGASRERLESPSPEGLFFASDVAFHDEHAVIGEMELAERDDFQSDRDQGIEQADVLYVLGEVFEFHGCSFWLGFGTTGKTCLLPITVT